MMIHLFGSCSETELQGLDYINPNIKLSLEYSKESVHFLGLMSTYILYLIFKSRDFVYIYI